ncbi:unnamed protein product [Rotaria sordida]|uniref:Uncharacterized protein n=1 Tax=Rotaria sordida TaxID=392033 RepID=A0A820GL65_9BILA|nr:unnamed protein product [Rotaria sordida]
MPALNPANSTTQYTYRTYNDYSLCAYGSSLDYLNTNKHYCAAPERYCPKCEYLICPECGGYSCCGAACYYFQRLKHV